MSFKIGDSVRVSSRHMLEEYRHLRGKVVLVVPFDYVYVQLEDYPDSWPTGKKLLHVKVLDKLVLN